MKMNVGMLKHVEEELVTFVVEGINKFRDDLNDILNEEGNGIWFKMHKIEEIHWVKVKDFNFEWLLDDPTYVVPVPGVGNIPGLKLNFTVTVDNDMLATDIHGLTYGDVVETDFTYAIDGLLLDGPGMAKLALRSSDGLEISIGDPYLHMLEKEGCDRAGPYTTTKE